MNDQPRDSDKPHDSDKPRDSDKPHDSDKPRGGDRPVFPGAGEQGGHEDIQSDRVVRPPRTESSRRDDRPRRTGSPRRADRPRTPVQSRDDGEIAERRELKDEDVLEDADSEWVVLPRETSAPRKTLTVLLAVVLTAGTLFGGLLLWASRQVNPPGPQGDAIEELLIPKGASLQTIAGILEDQEVIANKRVFKIYVGLKNKGDWKAGEYVEFRKLSSFDEAIKVLDDGPVAPTARIVRIAEGSRVADALEQIAEQSEMATVEQLQAALDSGEVRSSYKPDGVGSWEGLLFPDTYEFSQDDTPAVILQKIATKMDTVLDSLGYDRAQALAGRSAYELITIASLIEREAGQPPEERGKISRVISNRLDAGETLGIDASVLYGLGRHSGSLTKSDLEQDTPYNTRKVKGLPPTPIALSGEASLKAAIEPTPGDWKYYVLVSNDPPTHFFTDSDKEFIKAKADAKKRGVF